ncbi:proton/peptide symporter, POT family protein [Legionella hackeliae]|uniref:Proton/peptide symporter, POT family protein n=1 Tax=Legionella hackeliae TaxID=449 RepID=A0A0A8UVM6_LEGHA|nr:peptide MFS transporter [Legionella hackeliae]KTD09841.1 POT family transporter protein proton/peptide symporter [Legionella hackeliae]CEK10829.1 Proton/peptide symporter, POT family protein [Legionella hackeliae]STX47566.1 proton/peptide symporter, POT family protein [Legionella hackeliae]
MTNEHIKHPPSLKVFFATEMWERYGFYVVQTLLALYLAFYFKWQDERVYTLVGTFTALTYLSPVIGGWIADHLLGQKKAILAGAVFLFFSYLSLFILASDNALSAALAGIAVGTGLLKPNISSLLGNEYPENSPRRESGFTIFYMGITTGIILGTTLPSQLHEHFGWPVAFASAAFGMVIAFAVFAFGVHRYKIADYHPSEITVIKLIKTLFILFGLWSSAFVILHYPALADIAFGAVVLLSLLYLIDVVKRETPKQGKQTIVIGLLCIISVMFWAFYFQMFLSLTLFISRVVEPTLFGILFPPPYYVSIQSIGMIFFGYFLSRSRPQINAIHSGVTTGNKFILAMIFITLAYVLITLVSKSSHGTSLLSPLYFIPVYLLISIAELLLSPVGLAAITVLASRKKVSTMMGIFFVSLGIGAFLSGKLATLTAIKPEELSILQLKAHYSHTFTLLLFILLGATLICVILNRVIKSLLANYEELPA